MSSEYDDSQIERLRLSQVFDHVDSGAAALTCFGNALSSVMIISGLIEAGLGVALVCISSGDQTSCTFPLAHWALVFGAISVTFGATGVAMGLVMHLILFEAVAGMIYWYTAQRPQRHFPGRSHLGFSDCVRRWAMEQRPHQSSIVGAPLQRHTLSPCSWDLDHILGPLW